VTLRVGAVTTVRRRGFNNAVTRFRNFAGHEQARTSILDQVFPAERATSLVTVVDDHPHTLAFLATINRVAVTSLGVSKFGRAGSLQDVYRWHGIDADGIVRAALDVAG
jgi:pyruvate dehydrogenase E1 component